METISNLWHGRAGLAKTYWAYGVIGGGLWGIPLALVTPGSSMAIMLLLALIAYFMLVNTGIWRAAGQYTGSPIWALLAKVHAVVGYLSTLGIILAIVLPAQNKPMAQAPTTRPTPFSYAEAPPQTQPQQMPPSSPAGKNPLDAELEAMDRVHPGWREKVKSQKFHNWLAAQSEQVRHTYENTETAAQLSTVIVQYDQWVAGSVNQGLYDKGQFDPSTARPFHGKLDDEAPPSFDVAEHWTQEKTGSQDKGPWLNHMPTGSRFCRMADGTIIAVFPPGVKPQAEKANPFCAMDSVASPDHL